MIVTVLASVFILIVLVIAIAGFRAVIKKGKAPEDIGKERCSICREQFQTSDLIERQIGDYRLYYFCRGCVEALQRDLSGKS